MSTRTWSGSAVTAARNYLRGYLPCPCAVCGRPLTEDDAWVVGHIHSRAARPELTFDPTNWQVECRRCSDSSGPRVAAEARFLRQSPDQRSPRPSAPPTIRRSTSIEVPSRLVWADQDLSGVPWMTPLLDVPVDASVPLAMTPPHPDAVGSYGAEACAWIERTQRIALRWWQRLAITRQLEHDDAGRLLWRVLVESAPRRVGKSTRLRGVALWRLEHGADLFGETQLVLSTGKDVAITREIQQRAWLWAESEAGWKVGRGRGSEQIETPQGDRWLAKAKDAVYGFDVSLAMVDEAWGVDPAAVDEGLEPATLERPSPQLHLTSTAHRRATSLMRRRIGDALAADDGETLLLLWGAAPGADPGDPETWRAASPHWSEQRGHLIASRYAAALAGEADPEADDLDPAAGFAAQYLNQWSLRPTTAAPGVPVVEEDVWAGLTVVKPDASPDAAAVEGWPGAGLSVACAWRLDDEHLVVSVVPVPDVASAAAEIVAAGFRRAALVGASLVDDPGWAGLTTTSTAGAVRTSVADLARLLGEDVVRHDGGEHLTHQLLALRTSPGVDGPRVRSTGRADAVKAATWALQEARRKPFSWVAY